jgi:valyl-tRNA synthetase
MAMQGLHFMKEVPWKTLYLHGLVRDAHGQKMSKSKGNTVDPLGLIDKYGADALRFTLAAMESQGRDIKLDEKRVEGYRNFATKLWNAARFAQSNGIGASATLEPPRAELPVNRWIIAETVKTIQALDLALADLRYDESANTIYHFVWSTFCDWYLELIKPVLSPNPVQAEPVEASTLPSTEDEETKALRQAQGERGAETRAVAGWVFDQILVMLHPFMPFITEELWHAMGARPYDLIVAKWPMADARALDPEAQREIDWLIEAIAGIRAVRAELNVAPGQLAPIYVADASPLAEKALTQNEAAIRRLARVSEIKRAKVRDEANVPVLVKDDMLNIGLEGVIDIDAERARLTKGIAAAEKERDSLSARLNNPAFVEKAKPEAVVKAREDHAVKEAEAERLKAALERLG